MMLRGLAPLVLGICCVGQPPAQRRSEADVRDAMEAVRRNEPATIELQVRLCEIPAPPFAETVRGNAVKQMFEELGLRDVRTDAAGNVIGVRPGKAARPNLVFAAHLDTVFP